MTGEIIRQGDLTSHGGTVLEGSQTDICMGKPIAYIGHKVLCPQCKGKFPIVEGAQTTTFYGKGVALAGMRTACGATLIASQFTDIVEYGGAASEAEDRRKNVAANSGSSTDENSPMQLLTASGEMTSVFNDKFILLNATTGEPLVFTEYAVRRQSGDIEYGITDAKGCTHLLSDTEDAEMIDIYV